MVVREAGRRHLAVMNQNGQGSQNLAASLDVKGAPDWSPDGRLDRRRRAGCGGDGPVRDCRGRRHTSQARSRPGHRSSLVAERRLHGVCGRVLRRQRQNARVGGAAQAVRPDGTNYDLPLVVEQADTGTDLRVIPGSYRFLDQTHLVYRPEPESRDFWLIDLVSGERRQITQLANKGTVRAFDIAPDGKSIVFDRVRQNSDIVLIERPKK